jgi:hypothetical protein
VSTDHHQAGTATTALTTTTTTTRPAPHRVTGTARKSRRTFMRQLGTTLGVGLGVALLPGQAAAGRPPERVTQDCNILCSPYNCVSSGCCSNAHIFYCRCYPYARYVCLPGVTCRSFCTHSCPTGGC